MLSLIQLRLAHSSNVSGHQNDRHSPSGTHRSLVICRGISLLQPMQSWAKLLGRLWKKRPAPVTRKILGQRSARAFCAGRRSAWNGPIAPTRLRSPLRSVPCEPNLLKIKMSKSFEGNGLEQVSGFHVVVQAMYLLGREDGGKCASLL